MGLFQQLAAPSPFFFAQSEFPYTVKHTGKQRIQYTWVGSVEKLYAKPVRL